MKITTSAELVDKALKEIKTLTIDEAHSKMTEGKSNIIDIRDIRELQNSGRIEGAVHVPRGMLEFWLDPNSSYFQQNKIGNIKKMVLYCALGFRSALATKALQEMGFDNVSNAEGGFDSLKKIGLPIAIKEKR